MLASHGDVTGPGGQDVLQDTDGTLLVHHYYDRRTGGTPTLGVNLLSWAGGWPAAY